MFELKRIHRDAIPAALARVERYRLLNEARVAESICHDILAVEPDNQQALVGLVLSLTDLFGSSVEASVKEVLDLLPRLEGEYERLYYAGVTYERQGKSRLVRNYPGSKHDAYDLLHAAMEWFEKAERLHPSGNDDAILRWNSCARLITSHKLTPRAESDTPTMLE